MRHPLLLAAALLGLARLDLALPRVGLGQVAAEVSPTVNYYELRMEQVAAHVAADLRVEIELARQIADLVDLEAGKRQLDPWLVLGLIKVESHGDPWAVSPVGAIGLMQVMPRTGEAIANALGVDWEGAESLFDLETNIRFGCWYLARLFQRFKDPQVALAAYNWGPTHIHQRLVGGWGLPQVYPEKVLLAANPTGR